MEEAIASFWKAVKINPKSTDAYTNLGNALAIQGKAEEALAAFRNAIAISPTFDAYNNLGILLQSLGRTREAEESFRKAAELKKINKNGLGAPTFSNGWGNCFQHREGYPDLLSRIRELSTLPTGLQYVEKYKTDSVHRSWCSTTGDLHGTAMNLKRLGGHAVLLKIASTVMFHFSKSHSGM